MYLDDGYAYESFGTSSKHPNSNSIPQIYGQPNNSSFEGNLDNPFALWTKYRTEGDNNWSIRTLWNAATTF